MKTLTIKVPDALFAEITGVAKARNVPKSEVVRERLAQRPTRKQSKGSLWCRMEDLVVDSELLPADLSSNKSHLKGYGRNRSHR